MRTPISTFGPLAGGACHGAGRHDWPGGGPLEQTEQLVGDEARPRCIEVAIALRVLAVDEGALRHDQTEVVLCAGHGDVASSQVRWCEMLMLCQSQRR